MLFVYFDKYITIVFAIIPVNIPVGMEVANKAMIQVAIAHD